MVGPTADAREPRLEKPKLAITELIHELFQEKDTEDFFLQDTPAEKSIGYQDQELEISLP